MTFSTVGRARKLTDAQIAEILAWHRTKRSTKAMAACFGVSARIIHYIIKTAGRGYKRGSPND